MRDIGNHFPTHAIHAPQFVNLLINFLGHRIKLQAEFVDFVSGFRTAREMHRSVQFTRFAGILSHPTAKCA